MVCTCTKLGARSNGRKAFPALSPELHTQNATTAENLGAVRPLATTLRAEEVPLFMGDHFPKSSPNEVFDNTYLAVASFCYLALPLLHELPPRRPCSYNSQSIAHHSSYIVMSFLCRVAAAFEDDQKCLCTVASALATILYCQLRLLHCA